MSIGELKSQIITQVVSQMGAEIFCAGTDNFKLIIPETQAEASDFVPITKIIQKGMPTRTIVGVIEKT